MPDTHTITPQAEREMSRAAAISELISDHTDILAEKLQDLISDLTERGCFRIHRDWSAAAERKELAAEAAERAVHAVLNSPWCDLPVEVEAIHRKAVQS